MKKLLSIGIILCLILTSSGIAMAAENHNDQSQEVNLLEGGYAIYDAHGNMVPQPRTSIDSGAVTIPAGGSMQFSKGIPQTRGNSVTFYVSVTGGHVDELHLSTYAPSTFNLGYFTATKGDWYGTLAKKSWSQANGTYYFLVKNTSSVSIRIDSLTCLY